MEGDYQGPIAAGGLVFDGDQASLVFTVLLPPPSFSVSQTATCSAVPTVGVPDHCTITESVSNNTGDTLDFSHTVVNNLANNVTATGATASVGNVAINGSSVVWSNFQLAPHSSASASIQVTFTPSASQVGGPVALSNGITADAIDVRTGQRIVINAPGVTTPSSTPVQAARPSTVTRGTTPGRTVTRSPVGGGTTATTGQPGTSGTTGTTGSAVGRLPTTGGAADRQVVPRPEDPPPVGG